MGDRDSSQHCPAPGAAIIVSLDFRGRQRLWIHGQGPGMASADVDSSARIGLASAVPGLVHLVAVVVAVAVTTSPFGLIRHRPSVSER
jgi:hypothetical protein